MGARPSFNQVQGQRDKLPPKDTKQGVPADLGRGQVKVNLSADTERGEVIGMGGIQATGGVNKPSVPAKSNLSMAGGAIMEDGAFQRNQLVKKKQDEQSNQSNTTSQQASQGSKYSFYHFKYVI